MGEETYRIDPRAVRPNPITRDATVLIWDEYAMMAMRGLIIGPGYKPEELCAEAGRFADAMMAERSKRFST